MLKIKSPSEKIELTSIKTLLYGEPGIGKTTLALTAPSPLLIDCDKGIRRVSPQHRSDYMEVNDWNDIMELINSPAELTKYETLVPDTVGKLLDLLSLNIIKANHKMGSATGGLTLQGYGALQSEFRNFSANLTKVGKHLILVAHDRETSDQDRTKVRPDITGRSMGNVLKEMDLVGYIQSRNNERTVSFTPSDIFYAKNTCGLPNIIAIPDLTKQAKKPMTEIFEKFKQMLDSQAVVMDEYKALLSVLEGKIEMVTDAETAMTVSMEIKGMQEIWDSRTISRIMLNEKITALGLKYNQTSKLFEPIAK